MKVKKEWRNKSGIYKIESCSKVYIGSSVNLYDRLHQHVGQLRKNKHHSKYMQNYFNKYGEESFSIEILEYLEKNIPLLRKKEEDYMKNYLCEFNSTTPITYIHSENMKKQIANTMKKMWKENPSLNPRLNKGHRLWVYDFKGLFLYENVKPEELTTLLNYSNRGVFNSAIRKGRPIIDKKYIVLLNNDWSLLETWIRKRKGLRIPLFKLFKDGTIQRCTVMSQKRIINKVLDNPDLIYYSKQNDCFYTFIGLIEKCRLREEIPQIITAELSKEGENPNLN